MELGHGNDEFDRTTRTLNRMYGLVLEAAKANAEFDNPDFLQLLNHQLADINKNIQCCNYLTDDEFTGFGFGTRTLPSSKRPQMFSFQGIARHGCSL